MNRDYRGKIKENQLGNELDWVYGDLVRELKTGRTFILDLSHFDNSTTLESVLIEVIPETVGQYAGLKDKNGKEIYEGHIVKRYHVALVREDTRNGEVDEISVVYFDDDNLCMKLGDTELGVYKDWYFKLEVIGNIHDNKELLKVE